MKTLEIIISGKVQKVGFRSCIRHIAGKLSIKGEVMNLPDGRVRVFATGDPMILEKFVSMVYGCPRTIIRDLQIIDRDTMIFGDFHVRRSGT